MGFEARAQARGVADARLGKDQRRLAGEFLHQLVDVLELLQSFPTLVLFAPIEIGREPDRDGFGEVFFGMALSVVALEVAHEAAAVGARAKAFGIFQRSRAKELLPAFVFFQKIGVIEHVAHLMAQKTQTPGLRAAFDFHHHFFFEFFEPRVREIKRNGDGGRSFGTEPFVAEITDRLERNLLGGQLRIEFLDARFELGAGNLELEIADAGLQELLVAHGGEIRPGVLRLRRLFRHVVHPTYFTEGQNPGYQRGKTDKKMGDKGKRRASVARCFISSKEGFLGCGAPSK